MCSIIFFGLFLSSQGLVFRPPGLIFGFGRVGGERGNIQAEAFITGRQWTSEQVSRDSLQFIELPAAAAGSSMNSGVGLR